MSKISLFVLPKMAKIAKCLSFLSFFGLTDEGVKLLHLSPELRIRRIGIAAVAVFHPLGAVEEKPHLLVVATVGETLDDVNQFVRLVVLAAPFDGGQFLPFGATSSRQAVGEQGFHFVVTCYITLVSKPVDKGNKGFHTFLLEGIIHIEVFFRAVGFVLPTEEVIRKRESFRRLRGAS